MCGIYFAFSFNRLGDWVLIGSIKEMYFRMEEFYKGVYTLIFGDVLVEYTEILPVR